MNALHPANIQFPRDMIRIEASPYTITLNMVRQERRGRMQTQNIRFSTLPLNQVQDLESLDLTKQPLEKEIHEDANMSA